MSVVTQLAEALLAAMIQFSPPGYSMYSQVPIPYCDEACQATAICEDPALWRCRPPRLDMTLYRDKVQELVESGHSYEQASGYAKPLSYTRPETFEEGVARYKVIADAVVSAALRTSQRVCKHSCQKLTDEAEVITCHHACNAYAPWKWSYKELAYLTVNIWGHESGYRADVHGGVGGAGRGDCGYMKNGKQVSPKTEGATRFCKSVCLGQANLGLGYTMVAGHRWYAKDLVGIDYTSTWRCAMVTMSILSRSRAYCTGPMSPKTPDWAGATLSMYGTGRKCDAPNLMARSKSFYTMLAHPVAPSQNVLDILANPDVSETVSYLRSVSPVLWPVPFWDVLPTPSQIQQADTKLATEIAELLDETATSQDQERQQVLPIGLARQAP